MKPFIHPAILILLGAIFYYGADKASAQSTEPFSFNSEILPSAEAFEMQRYGKAVPSLYSGAMEYSIPLYTYKDEDFEIPVSINYSYDGFRPALHSEPVGLGWTLSCGGIITREVRGLPDEYDDPESNESGYYWTVKRGITGKYADEFVITSGKIRLPHLYADYDEIFSLNVFTDTPAYEHFGDIPGGGGARYDPNPDLFRFSFMGYSGSFMMDKSGNMKIFSTSTPHGELSVEYDFEKKAGLPTTEIIITTGNGCRYYFGGESSSIEYSYQDNPDGGSYPVTAAWKLRKIEAPNRKTAEFIYSKDHQRDISAGTSYSPKIDGECPEAYSYNTPLPIPLETSAYYPLIECIRVNSHDIITFIYDEKEHPENTEENFISGSRISSGFYLFNKCAEKSLSAITVTDTEGKEIEHIGMEKQYMTSNANRMFLSEIKGNKLGKFSFTYDIAGKVLPDNDTRSTDHWGFSNGKLYSGDITSHINTAGRNLYSQLSPGFEGKDPSFTYTKTGALETITYPTGGSTEIEYEQNSASVLVDMRYGITPGFMYNDSGFGIGGIRVKKISNRAGDFSDFTAYSYNDPSDGDKSSGILMSMPRYFMKFDYMFKAGHYVHIKAIGFTDECLSSSHRDNYIAYRYVRETYPDGSFTEYRFKSANKDYDIYPPVYDTLRTYSKTYMDNTERIQCYEGDDPVFLKKYILPPVIDKSSIRGKIESVKEYDGNGMLKKATDFEYETVSEVRQTMIYNTLTDYTEVPWECCGTYLVSKKETVYDKDMAGEERIESLDYNESGQVVLIRNHADSVTTIFRLKYLHEDPGAQISPALRSSVSSTVKSIYRDNAEYILSGAHYKYADPDNSMPTEISEYSCAVPYRLPDKADIFSTPPTGKVKKKTFAYDSSNRPVLVKGPGSSYISYSWDEEGRHITKKTKNHPDNTFFYDWKELSGLKEMRFPTGISEKYEYDAGNRLSGIRNHHGEYMRKYFYHFNNE